jgi:hypothetical protein
VVPSLVLSEQKSAASGRSGTRALLFLGGICAAAVLLELLVRVGAVLLVLGIGGIAAWLGFMGRRLRRNGGSRWLLPLPIPLVLATWVLSSEAGINCAGKPRPPTQVVRGRGLHLQEGAPVWREATDREHRACADAHPERLRVLFLGSSITYGSSLSADETFTTELERRLNAAFPSPGVCVLNFAQPGFAFEQKLAVATVELPRYRPAVVLWEGWQEWSAGYRMLGNAAFSLHRYELTADGYPQLGGVPVGGD